MLICEFDRVWRAESDTAATDPNSGGKQEEIESGESPDGSEKLFTESQVNKIVQARLERERGKIDREVEQRLRELGFDDPEDAEASLSWRQEKQEFLENASREKERVLPRSGGSMAGDINLTGSASLKGPNNSTLIKARNAANTADINLLSVNTSDQTVIGQSGANNIIIFDQRLVGDDDDTGIKMNGVNNIEFWGNGVVVASISRVIGVRIYDGDFIFNTDASGDSGKTGANRPDSIYAKSLVSVEAGGLKFLITVGP